MPNKFTVDDIKQIIFQHLSQDTDKSIPIVSIADNKRGLLGINDLLKYEGDQFVKEVYLSILNREPDPIGFDSFRSWLQKGASKHWIIWSIKNSQEGKSKNVEVIGLIEPKTLNELLDLDKQKFIQESYKTLLWREADTKGLEHFLRKLDKGVSKISVLSEIAYSDEGKNTPTEFTKIYSIKPPLKYIINNLLNREYLSSLISKANKKIKQIIKSPFQVYDISSSLNHLINKHEYLTDTIINKLHDFRTELNDKSSEQINKLQNLEMRLNTISTELGNQVEHLEIQINELKYLCEKTSSSIELISKRQIVSAGNNTVFVKLEDFSLALPAEDLRLVFYLSYYNTLEAGLTSLFKKIVEPGMVVVDIGAHVGIYTLLAAPLVGSTGKVYSFEPTPRTFDFLKLNIEINACTQQVIAKQIAITDKKSLQTLSISEHSGLNSLYAFSEEDKLVEVETHSLDVILSNELQIDVIKIDTEGAEPFVWKGMQRIREQNPNLIIFMEFAPTYLLRAGVNPKDFLHEIHNDGFHTAKVDDFSGEIYPITEEALLDSNSVNLIIRKNYI
ncbi:FkbM family methyltransferase [Nostoc commune]|uniref:FkbM family methyltransferase n=1 Tax=Nostoc commune TaxID=1178 RepID=UPI0018C67512|nr:FkbM family methyltransferase [Nostoc commune]MBG1260433.1 FkbM family methyltransferase [Nostoc commune BAE]